jgi:hypothetical protein
MSASSVLYQSLSNLKKIGGSFQSFKKTKRGLSIIFHDPFEALDRKSAGDCVGGSSGYRKSS